MYIYTFLILTKNFTGITHVVNVTLEQKVSDFIKEKRILKVPLHVDVTSNLSDWFEKTNKFISSALNKKFVDYFFYVYFIGTYT